MDEQKISERNYSNSAYSWGELYDTLKEMERNGDTIEDELFQRFFKVVETLEDAKTYDEISNTIKSLNFSTTEINRINSSCLDGLLEYILSNERLRAFVGKTTRIDTVNFLIKKNIIEYSHLFALCPNKNKLQFDMKTILTNAGDELYDGNRLRTEIFDEICESNPHVSVLEQFLQFFPEMPKERPHALISACINCDIPVIRCLLDHGTDIHVKEEDMLYSAALFGKKETVKFLVANGAKIIPEKRIKSKVIEKFHTTEFEIDVNPIIEKMLKE